MTIVSMYAVHYLFKYYKEKYEFRARGRIVGDSAFSDSDDVACSNNCCGGTVDGSSNLNVAVQVQENSTSDRSISERGNDADQIDDANTTISKDLETEKEEEEDVDKGGTKLRDGNRRMAKIGTRRNRQRVSRQSTSEPTATQTPPPLTSSKSHPGLNEFWIWAKSVSETYRVYTIGPKYGEEMTAVPILTRSERGNIPVEMHVSNQLIDVDINVYWINFKGKEVLRGSIRRLYGSGNSLRVTTWVGHPWVFRNKANGKLLLHFVPYKVMPFTLADSKDRASDSNNNYFYGDDNEDTDDEFVGKYEFTIAEPNPLISGYNESVSIIDKTIPHPLNQINSINQAIKFSCDQMEREDITPRMLLKYLYNVSLHPTQAKFRQIRTSNKIFFNNVWINGGRGVLHALGFEERGGYIEMGPNVGSLPGERLKHLSDAIVMLEELAKDMEDGSRNETMKKPLGTDGYSGRAGWGV